MLRVEVNYLTVRTLNFEVESNEGLEANLDLLDDKREKAELRRKTFQERIAKVQHAKVKLKDIRVGDLVLKQTKLGSRKPEGGVFGLNWEGPYGVIAEQRTGVYKIQDYEGRDLERSYHLKALKRFYV